MLIQGASLLAGLLSFLGFVMCVGALCLLMGSIVLGLFLDRGRIL